MDPKSKHSYNKFMYDNLFNHIDVQKENINIPRGDLTPNEVEHKSEHDLSWQPRPAATPDARSHRVK